MFFLDVHIYKNISSYTLIKNTYTNIISIIIYVFILL